MAKVVIIGAGSGFGSRLSKDILACESTRDATIALCDIHAGRLEDTAQYVRRLIDGHNLPARLEADTDRTKVLEGADFVVTAVSIGGAAYWGNPYAHEVTIPNEYGVSQSVADTIGPGGVFRFLRTAPEQLAFCHDIERYCPDALLLNYTNPMAMLTWAHYAGSSVRNIGLCHSVQGTTRRLAKFIDVPYEEITYKVAGINHQAWVLSFRRGSEDLYPRIREAMDDPAILAEDPVRFELMRHFGYFVTESSTHNSEYVPYFRRTPELLEQYDLKPRTVRMDDPGKRQWLQDSLASEDVPELVRSHEYASGIIEAVVTNRAFKMNGSVENTGLISNLPDGCCVEVPCVVDAEGIQPCHVGFLPPQLAALNRSNIAVQELAVQAALEHDREAAYHAVALDPLTAAVVPLPKIREMFDRMWEAEGDLLAYFDE